MCSLEEVKAIAHSMWNQPDWNRSLQGIIDLRESEILIGMRDIPDLVMFIVQNKDLVTERMTLIVNTPLNTVTAMMAKSRLSEIVGINIYTMEENALADLGISAAEFQELNNDDQPNLILVFPTNDR